jgi:hypothetical protein
LSTYWIAEHVFSQSGYPLVVVVEPGQYRNSHHLVPCIGRGTRRTTRFRDLLLITLMGSCPVEVCYIPIKYTLELLLAKDQQVVKAFLAHTPQEAFAHRIGAGSVIWCSKAWFK